MVTIWQVIKGSIYFSIGLLLAYIIPGKIGGFILDIFTGIVGANSGLLLIFIIMRWLIILVLAVLAPIILLTNSGVENKLIKQFG